ncbi:MAG: bile acid:sodium symporter [Halomonas sp.]|uniref:arsenic resistance protein n=1 Tax=Halomonas sp. TaxID=1486246 RepID=UPI003970B11B
MTRNLTLAIPVAMLLGLFYGLIAPTDWLRTLIVPLTLLMVYPMMVNLKLRKLLEGGDIKSQLLAQAINFAIIPFVAFALGRLWFPEQPYLALGLLLAALLPTSGMTIAWTGFAKGNLAAAVKMTVVGLILGSLATPFYVQWLMGATVPVDLIAVFLQIALVVFLPMLAGQLTQTYLIRRHGQQAYQQHWAPRFPPLSTLGVLGIVFVAIALKGGELVAQPLMLLDILVPLLALYAFNYAFSTFVAKRLLPRGDAIALVYGTVMRNLSIALALAMNAFGEASADAALLIAVAYILQVQSAAWYVKLSDRFFGPKPF